MIDYANFILAASKFSEGLWIPFEDSLANLNMAIDSGQINKDSLREEFRKANSNIEFDWKGFAVKSELLENPDLYFNHEILDYVRSLFLNMLQPEASIDSLKLNNLTIAILNILKSYDKDDGWVLSYDLFNSLERRNQFEHFHIGLIDFESNNIEQKQIEGKDVEIGYLRYKQPKSFLEN